MTVEGGEVRPDLGRRRGLVTRGPHLRDETRDEIAVRLPRPERRVLEPGSRMAAAFESHLDERSDLDPEPGHHPGLAGSDLGQQRQVRLEPVASRREAPASAAPSLVKPGS